MNNSVVTLYCGIGYFIIVYTDAEDEPEDGVDASDDEAFPVDGNKEEYEGEYAESKEKCANHISIPPIRFSS